MNDKEFLMWIHDRLANWFHVDRDTDYMIRLKKIIDAMPNEVRQELIK